LHCAHEACTYFRLLQFETELPCLAVGDIPCSTRLPKLAQLGRILKEPEPRKLRVPLDRLQEDRGLLDTGCLAISSVSDSDADEQFESLSPHLQGPRAIFPLLQARHIRFRGQ
jgi:hypothetical protein